MNFRGQRIGAATCWWLACWLALAPLLWAGEPEGRNQDLLIKLWGGDEGMPSSVTSVAQTPEGYLWVGTLMSGLLRFDGTRFVNFGVASGPELVSLLGVRRLLVDRAGRLWISTYANTLITWEHGGFRTTSVEKVRPEQLLWSSESEVIFLNEGKRLLRGVLAGGEWRWQEVDLPSGPAEGGICADSEGRVWRLRNEQEIWCWQEGRTNTLNPVPGLEDQRLRLLVADGQGRIWAGTEQTVARWHEGRFVGCTPPGEAEGVAVKRLIPAGSSLWVEANGRLRRLAEGRWVAECEDWAELASQLSRSRFLYGDRKGGLWGSVRDQGLFFVAPDGKRLRLTTRDGLPGNSLQFAFQDREGNTWTGYQRGGLVQIRPRLFRALGREQGMTETLVNSVCVDNAGAVWVGTHGGEAFRFQQGQAASMFPARDAEDAGSVVTADPAGGVWIGNFAGEVLHSSGPGGAAEKVAQLPRAVRLLLAGRDGRLWIATMDGIWVLAGKTLTRYYWATEVASRHNYLASLGESADGTIWAGTFQGLLLRFDGRHFVPVEPPDYSQLGRLWALCPAPEGGLWIGTSAGGVLRYQEGKFRRYTREDGLPTDRITQVLADTFGNLWLGTEAGIVRLAETVLRRYDRGEMPSLTVSRYGKTDGLTTSASAIEFQPNCWRASDGSLWFAMANSVAQVDPSRLAVNPIPPGVTLEDVRANGRTVWPARLGAVYASTGGALEPASEAPVAVRLGPGRQDVEFEFAALSLASPQGVRFRYRLEGVEHEWTEPRSERRVSYHALGPGDYRFEVQACNSDGLWNEEGVALKVRVLPHFWQMAWFTAALVCGGVLLVGAAVALPLRARHRRRLAFQMERMERQRAVERERTRVAQDLHDDLGAGLTEIGLLAGMLHNRTVLPETEKHQALGRIVQRARYLVSALDEIVWALNPRNDSARSLGGYFCRYAQEFFEPTGMRCRLDFREGPRDLPLNSEQRHHVFLAFKEILTNVARHSGASEVQVSLSLERAGWLEIVVQDNGHGLPPVTGPDADGLSNLRARIEKLQGTCEVQNLQSGGVRVQLSVPLNEAAEGES